MEVEKILLEMHGKVCAMEISLKEIKDDLRYHIKRTDQNEARIELESKTRTEDIFAIKKHIYKVQGALALIGLISVVIGTLYKVGLI